MSFKKKLKVYNQVELNKHNRRNNWKPKYKLSNKKIICLQNGRKNIMNL